MPDRFWVNPDLTASGGPGIDGLAALLEVVGSGGDVVSSAEGLLVRKRTLGGRPVYGKLYFSVSRLDRYRWIGRRSRARCEWEAALAFQRLGLRTPRLLAYGEHASLLTFKWGALLMDAVEDSVDLREFFGKSPKDDPRRLNAMEQLGQITARLHDNRFFHHTLKFRNLLIQPDRTGCDLWLIDCPAGSFRRFGWTRCACSDLLTIAKDLQKWGSAAEWLHFLNSYCAATGDDLDALQARLTAAGARRYGWRNWPLALCGAAALQKSSSSSGGPAPE